MSYQSILRRISILACLLAAPAWAHTVAVSGAWVRGTVAGQTATGAFLELKASEAAVLLGVASPVAKVIEVHEMVMEKDVMRMRAIPKLDLPAGKTVELKPGGYHIMLMGLVKPLKKGDTVPLTLKIEGRDKKPITVEVKAEVRDQAPPMMMEGHEHMHH